MSRRKQDKPQHVPEGEDSTAMDNEIRDSSNVPDPQHGSESNTATIMECEGGK